MARGRGRDPAAWFIVCFLFSALGLLALLIGGNTPAKEAEEASEKTKRQNNIHHRAKKTEEEAEVERIRWMISQGIDPKS